MHRAKAMTIAGTLGFAIVSVIVILGGAVSLDGFVYRTVAPLSGPLFVYVTELGSVKVLIALAFVGMLYWLWRGDKLEAFRLPLVVIGTLVVTQLLKRVYGIDRPLIDAALDATTYSFPSGHASGSLALYGLLAFSLYRRKYSPVWVAVLVVLLVAVSFSRVILNVHYFSDVMGGWLVAFTVIAGSEWIIGRKNR
ncbi:phosphatase PAP2 family protein [Exiguobacterium sp. SH3S2]|uniref:phosphatase PAP2 family protein n=1 Tax=unclassified Exiguobacterium TaxID=2644629 RepID=UPI00103E61BE|nr:MULTISPECIES: phosphatase PAP2 family protein [unclassified Exiguobacterium]TCI26528.1 phosphatase PAP2 family protein [Exiguobacterium sp. SH5S4]TCI49101.1 phosphatase PAP2 family protein [Exiguobacterium sp. SH3S3]TCI64414.1 phosphatase PAP2 family protein [Exiguobacterium sp. SH3S2]TCI66259.1 phosphatase PAP2 family protein [Exiguobacterium sp. SH3S1]